MKEKLYQSLIELSNGKTSSKILQLAVQSVASKKLIRSYSNLYEINLEEVSKSSEQFLSLHDFFTRHLKEDARPLDQQSNIFTSPVDAKIEAFGKIVDGMTFTVKNKPYSLMDLLGNETQAKRYENGQYIVFYLSPADYHRIHSPIDGHVKRQYVLGRKSYPVNQMGLTFGKKPLSHNYRMISEIEYNGEQTTAFIKVGATFVNSIELTNVTTTWKKGEEVGYFTFGSTVVMLFEENAVQFNERVVQGTMIKMGEAFATML
ncbi:phosphatidylserine decarboxylase [Solibacillus sp. R5-41]|uniref:phosphatidylserine decarboxylase n=1 Tax=Solibacillus sp. R5-41 TaxID=2048654 RepID=UPI000C128646|nr:phosphatidylserine decarboxylase [Solibacillus sp. R5-41]ATP41218.1 phosphatidylserine decarboxylase [Solibacillus sp. R5-41]